MNAPLPHIDIVKQADAEALPLTLPAGRRTSVGWQMLPGDGDLDGMYYALLSKAAQR
jgi:16S rRNA (cytosine967-C5)-methyltransferase